MGTDEHWVVVVMVKKMMVMVKYLLAVTEDSLSTTRCIVWYNIVRILSAKITSLNTYMIYQTGVLMSIYLADEETKARSFKCLAPHQSAR